MTQLPILNCHDCDACCQNVGHPMFDRGPHQDGVRAESAWTNLPNELKQEHIRFMAALDRDDYGQPCYWLDTETRRCKHYDHRPRVCREFEVGGEACSRLRSAYLQEDGEL